jgi:hypothetical protein
VKAKITFVLSLFALCAAFSCPSAYAQTPSPVAPGLSLTLTIRGQATVSLPDNLGNSLDKFSVATTNITTASILNLLFVASGKGPGTKLVLDSSTRDVLVEDKLSDVIEDATTDGFLSVQLELGTIGGWDGQANISTGAQKFSGSYTSSIQFDDGLGNYFSAQGLTKESYSISAKNAATGHSKALDSLSWTATGFGSWTVETATGPHIDIAVISLTLKAGGKGSL